MSGELHVVFGAGQVGPRLAARLLADGHRVRVVKRSPAGAPPGAELLTGDAADPAFCGEAARGAAVVYHCLNPDYSAAAWAKFVPLYVDNLVTAAGRAGARLVVLDNLYMMGRPAGRPLNEDTPVNPCSRKGEIRARAAERLFAAHERGDVRASCGRASDFYGPGGAQTFFGERLWKPALAGRTARVPTAPDAVHTYHYIPDVAAGLAALGAGGEDTLGRPWMLPCAPAGTLRELVARFATTLGRPLPVARLPRPLLTVAGFFVPIVRELDEMSYQWDEPFVVDDARFRARFDLQPVPPDQAARETVDWAVKEWGGKARPAQ